MGKGLGFAIRGKLLFTLTWIYTLHSGKGIVFAIGVVCAAPIYLGDIPGWVLVYSWRNDQGLKLATVRISSEGIGYEFTVRR